MSDIEDKILGKDEKKSGSLRSSQNYFSSNVVWQVSRKDCGKSFVNGIMVYEMLSFEGKAKARKGKKKIIDKGFEFIRL